MPDNITEVAIISILENVLGNINTKPLTIIGIINKLTMIKYME